jgi:hypothetical protein
MPKLRLILDTHRQNLRLSQYTLDVVMTPLDHAVTLVDAFHTQMAGIQADRHLTGEGKTAARAKAASTTLAAIQAWHEPRLRNLDADLLAQRAALIPQTERPDARQIDLMSAHLLKHTPADIAVFWNSATEPERRLMEAASAAVGRVPMKTANGLEWKTLLDPDMVNEGILARAAATNPAAAQRVQELTEIRALQVSIAGIAAAEVREALSA